MEAGLSLALALVDELKALTSWSMLIASPLLY